MPTKCIVIGQENKKTKNLKPIEFSKLLGIEYNVYNTTDKPNEYDNIELICKNYAKDFDLMFAYDKDRSGGVLYIGHWNDGVVEEI